MSKDRNTVQEAAIPDDVFCPEATEDPYGFLARLREERPMHFSERFQLWMATRYADVRRIDRDHGSFSAEFYSRDLRDPFPPVPEKDLPLHQFAGGTFARWMSQQDPPLHTELRMGLEQKLSKEQVQQWAPMVSGAVDGLFDEVDAIQRDRGEVDFVQAYAMVLPITVLLAVMDMEADIASVREIADGLAHMSSGAPDRLPKLVAAIEDLFELLDPAIEDRIANPGNDLLSAMVDLENQGLWTRDHVRANGLFMLFAGHETTRNSICAGLLALATHHHQWELLRSDPQVHAAAAVEEILRYEPPLKSIMRIAAKDTEICGETIRAGERIRAFISSANRDPDMVDRPDHFDIAREASFRHLAFGFGPHFCMGAHLARLELTETFKQMALRYQNIELLISPDAIPYSPSISFRAPRALPVRFA